MTIHKWSELQHSHWDALLLGNGASIAIASAFSYKSLYREACAQRILGSRESGVFEVLGTEDFELVLRALWTAELVNRQLAIEGCSAREAYSCIKECLVTTLQRVHAKYTVVERKLGHMSAFLRRFGTVVSLNYDLLVYWAIMHKDAARSGVFKDCFVDGIFANDWEGLRVNRLDPQQSSTLVFYAHGNLALGMNSKGEDFKIKSHESEVLLASIESSWKDGVTPLIVSEGKSEQKQAAIRRSFYLNTVHQEVLPRLGGGIVIYGWSMSEQDQHILEAICKGEPERIAVSVLASDDDCDDYMEVVRRKLRKELKSHKFELEFFDAESDGCWIHPTEVSERVGVVR